MNTLAVKPAKNSLFSKTVKTVTVAAGSVLAMAGFAFAEPVTIDSMWSAVDLSGISTNIITLFLVIIAISLVFTAGGYIKAILRRARA